MNQKENSRDPDEKNDRASLSKAEIKKIKAGLEDIESGQTLPHHEVITRIKNKISDRRKF